jgi:hypothetical protein
MSLSQSRRNRRICPIALTLTAVLAVTASAQERQSNGNSLLAEVAEKIRSATVSAKTSVKVHAFGQTIYGEGTYAQCPLNNELLIRTDLKVKLVSQRESHYQLNRNQNELIVQHNLNDGREFVGRISLRRLREAGVLKSPNLATAGVPGATTAPALAPVDGIASTLEALSTHFLFRKVQSKEVDGAHYVAMRGDWKLASRAFGQGEEGTLPDAVEVVIETLALEKLPRFPRSITYLKRGTKGGVATLDPMVVIQYEEIESPEPSSVDVKKFMVKLGDHLKVVDITDQYLVPPPQ